MILRSDEIAERLKAGQESGNDDPFVIAPMPILDNLSKAGSVSLDLRLGCWFVTLRHARMSHLEIDGSTSELKPKLSKTHYVPFGSNFYLHPQNFVLGTTLEWIRLPRNLGGYVIGKSSWGRRGLIIATATGVHPGFKGCLTLELTNVGEIPIAISPGMEICQICLHVSASSALSVDNSQFVGLRQPSLGHVERDKIADALSRAYSMEHKKELT